MSDPIEMGFVLFLRQNYDQQVTMGLSHRNGMRNTQSGWEPAYGEIDHSVGIEKALYRIISQKYNFRVADMMAINPTPLVSQPLIMPAGKPVVANVHLVEPLYTAYRANSVPDLTWLPADDEDQISALCGSMVTPEMGAFMREAWDVARTLEGCLLCRS